MAAEKMWWKSQSVYPPEMIQTSLLGRLQKKSLEHNEACMWHLHWNGVPGNPPQKMLMCYSNAFKRRWRNIEKICLDIILLTLDMILHIFLWPKAHLFWFNCNFHVGILSNKEAILWRCTLKELFSVKPSQNISKKEPILIKLAPMLKMFCVTNVLLGTWSTFTDQLF